MIFISYSSKDLAQANKLCEHLERRGIPCWIAARNIAPGENYQESINEAIQRAQALVVLLTNHAITSAEIKKEMSLASAYKVPVIPARAEPVTPTGAFKYELATTQWIDLFDNWETALDRLAARIKNPNTEPQPAAPTLQPKRKSTRVVLLCAALGLLAAAGLGVILLRHQTTLTLRAEPTKLLGSQIDAMLIRLDLYDARRNPAGHGVHHRLTPQAIGNAIVITDEATNLMWQKIGSKDGMPLPDTTAYIANLNTKKLAGFTDWRLPTLEEAMTLNEKRTYNDWHIPPEFLSAESTNIIWTSDRSATSGRGLVVYYYDGFVSAESPDYNAYVRAVRGISQ
jgi:hypothetical protein